MSFVSLWASVTSGQQELEQLHMSAEVSGFLEGITMRGSFLQDVLFEVVPPMAIVHGTGLFRMLPLLHLPLVIPSAMGVTGSDAFLKASSAANHSLTQNLLPLH